MKDNNNIIGNNIRRILKDRHISQEKLGEMIGSSRQQVGAYVTGRHTPSPAAFIKIAKALDVTQYELQGTPEELEIVNTGLLVMNIPALKEMADMVKRGDLTEEQLSGVLNMVKSF